MKVKYQVIENTKVIATYEDYNEATKKYKSLKNPNAYIYVIIEPKTIEL
jgi:hypothetical protein